MLKECTHLSFFDSTGFLVSFPLLVDLALASGWVFLSEVFQYKKNCKTMIPFRKVLMMKFSLKRKSSVSNSTVANLAALPPNERKNVKKASCPVDLFW